MILAWLLAIFGGLTRERYCIISSVLLLCLLLIWLVPWY